MLCLWSFHIIIACRDGSEPCFRFGRDFDQSLEGVVLPPELRHLSFGREFNQELREVQLPPKLESSLAMSCSKAFQFRNEAL